MARRLYDGAVPLSSPGRRTTATGLLVAAAGTGLFIWLVRSVGPGEIWNGFRQIGGGLGWIFILGGLRFATRAAAWMLCMEPPHRLRFWDAFSAVVCGDALGNLTPFGPLVSEPAKIACVRGRVPVGAAVTALAIENVIYTLSVAAMIAAGAVALIFSVELPIQLREFSEVAVTAIVALFALAGWMLWRRPDVLGKVLPAARSRGPRIEKLRIVEQQVLTFASRRRAAMPALIMLELGFHALGVAEKHLTLWLILGAPPDLLASFIVETVDRLITVAFKFVPFQVGVGEAGTGRVTMLLGLGLAPGVTLSIVRKARMAIWSVIGAVLLVRQGLSARRVLEEAQRRNSDE
jgi:hypothetical protein